MSSSLPAILQLIDREVWIVTAAANGRRGGLCATWVSLASLDPAQPIMLIGLAPNHFTAELIEHSGAFALHLLLPTQTELALQFANGSGRDRDKFAGLRVATGITGSPQLVDCLAVLDCRVFARYDAGDRWFYWADVLAGELRSAGPPLREKEMFAAASAETKQALLANRNDDMALHRPLHELWRRANPFVAKASVP